MAAPRFYFAWVDPEEITFDVGTHARVDEEIVSLLIEQTEGEFAGLTIDIKNPRVGFLAPTRKVWAWVSWINDANEVVPLFFGRLVALPNDINREVVTLNFIARPSNFDYLKTQLAETLKVEPFWDTVFIAPDKRDDPDSVMESRSSSWHIDRVNHDVTISDLLVGEDGVEEFQESEVPYESVGITLRESPARSINVIASVSWTQTHQNLSAPIVVYRNAIFPDLPTLGLKDLWPKTGQSLGGGWEVAYGEAHSNIDNIETVSTQVDGGETKFPDGSSGTTSISVSQPEPEPPGVRYITSHRGTSTPTSRSVSTTGFYFASPTVYGSLILTYDANRGRTEQAFFTLSTDVQDLITMPGEDEAINITVNGTDVGIPIDAAGTELPIGSAERRSYFATDRGLRSVEYLLLVARAALVLRSRAVEVSFECSFQRAVSLSLRKNAWLHDFRIPGGAAIGKIIRYAIRADGEGSMRGEVTLASAVGTGGAIASVPGEPAYVEEWYVETGYQFYEGQVVALGTGDVGYGVFPNIPNDDGLNFPITNPFLSGPTVSFARKFGPDQYGPLGLVAQPPNGVEGKDLQQAITKWANMVEARLDFTLRPVAGSKFNTAYNIQVTPLRIPAGINLGAL